MAEQTAGPSMLAHMVYFTLKDDSSAAREKLLADCREFLTEHSGTAFFAAGTLSDLARPVNDREYHVALQVVFESRAAHDEYQISARHRQFIERNKDSWSQVRAFDADVQ